MQTDIAYKALTDFCNAPHRTNIDLVPKKENEIDNQETVSMSMWNLWKKDQRLLRKKQASEECALTSEDTSRKSWADKEGSESMCTARYYKSFDKLSWATAGYHYDWTTRSYNENMKSPMPPIMSALGSLFAELDPSLSSTPPPQGQGQEQRQEHDQDSSNENEFTASASIINYYSIKSNMGGHRDDLELDRTKPVVSISLGLPAVFLLGGKSKEEEPVIGILVRPGDVMLLAGGSRLCFHGMARVIPKEVVLPRPSLEEYMTVDSDVDGDDGVHYKSQIGSWNDECMKMNKASTTETQPILLSELITPEIDVDAVAEFLSKHRININLRQVLPNGMDTIPFKNNTISARS
jgi:alkylated DNA repair protein alkB family protein 1